MKNWYPQLLRCPVCGSSMNLIQGRPDRVVCEHRHSYDASRWINFLTRPVSDHYSKELFEARYEMWTSGWFDPLAQQLTQFLRPDMTLLDAGCGEGSPLERILSLCPVYKETVKAIGVDLSRDGIRMASGREKKICFLVGDLTHLPLADDCSDIVLNLLSPACYAEFARTLKTGGLLVKVIPEEGYLKELRGLLPVKQQSLLTSREAVAGRLLRHFETLSSERLTLQRKIANSQKIHLVNMTPLCTDLSAEQRTFLANRLSDRITLDLTILTACPKVD